MKRSIRMTNAEWEVMVVSWQLAPVAASVVAEQLHESKHWSNATVRTLLRRLVTKGALDQQFDGKKYLYTPLVSMEDCVHQESDSFWDRVLGPRPFLRRCFTSSNGRIYPGTIFRNFDAFCEKRRNNMNALTGLERGFGWLLQTTWQAAVVTVIILLVQFLLRRRLSPAWRHGLWFLLVARLLMPMTPSSAVSVFNLANWSRRQAARVSVQAPAAEALDLASSVVFARPEKPEVQSAAPPSALTRQIPEPIATKPFPPARASQPARPAAHPLNLDWMGVAALVWLAGVLVLVSRLGVLGAPVWFPYRRCQAGIGSPRHHQEKRGNT